MNTSQVLILVGLIAFVDLGVLPIIIYAMVNGSWGELERKFPARPLGNEAVRRDFQSVHIDLCSFGGSVHIAVDETCLHILPTKFLRWFKAGPISIPWEAVESVEPSWPRKYMKARVAGKKITTPRWALEMAIPPLP